jgi:hypothetical protein
LQILAPKGIFDQKFGPLNFFDQDFGPRMKKVGHPCHRATPSAQVKYKFDINLMSVGVGVEK